MVKTDEEALMCDLAETYNIYDYRRLPARTVAVFSVGLRADSRIYMKMTGRKIPDDLFLKALIADRLTTLVWFKTTDGQKNRRRPESLVASLLGETSKQKARRETRAFSSPESFMEYRKKFIGGMNNG